MMSQPSVVSSIDAPLMLSVSGARGIVGKSMTPSVAAEFAAAFGTHARESTGKEHPVLCLGQDSRPSGSMIAAAATAGLTAVGCRIIRLGVVTTPSVAVMIDRHEADAGMVVTASHNPIIWNGLKCLNADGLAPSPDIAQRIITRYRERQYDFIDVESLQTTTEDKSTHDIHVEKVLFHIDTESINSAGFKVVLDSVNGAGCLAGRMLLEQLGCEVVHLNGEPHGNFAHPPEPIEDNLTDLAQLTATEGAVCGFAQDPDADRLAIVDETGRFIGEEYTLVLATKRLLDLHGSGVLAANLSTSRMIDDLAAQYPGSRVIRTAVGEANVAGAMQNEIALVGGEGNGGVIFPPICWVRDSLSAMALVLGLIADQQKPLSEIVNNLPRYAMIKRKFDLSSLPDNRGVPEILEDVTREYASERIDTTDGVRIDFADGWVHLRASNTEPIMRLIAEAPTTDETEALIAKIAGVAQL